MQLTQSLDVNAFNFLHYSPEFLRAVPKGKICREINVKKKRNNHRKKGVPSMSTHIKKGPSRESNPGPLAISAAEIASGLNAPEHKGEMELVP